jgi:hypothetical protein
MNLVIHVHVAAALTDEQAEALVMVTGETIHATLGKIEQAYSLATTDRLPTDEGGEYADLRVERVVIEAPVVAGVQTQSWGWEGLGAAYRRRRAERRAEGGLDSDGGDPD